MKKKFLYGISVLAIAAVAAWNVGLNLNSQNSNNLSDILNWRTSRRSRRKAGVAPRFIAAAIVVRV